MFSDNDFKFINVECTDSDLEKIAVAKSGKRFIVKGIVSLDILGDATIISSGVQ